MINSGIRHTIYLTQEQLDTIEDMNFPAIPFEDDSTIKGALINSILSQIVDPANRDFVGHSSPDGSIDFT